jgi:SAM-dependent methyltransferase
MAQYDDVAADYARLIAPRYVPIARLVADRVLAVPLPAAATVVEIAAGTGLLTSMVAPGVPAGGSFTATDVSPAMVALARSALGATGVRHVCADAFGLPFRERAADLVTSSLGPLQEDVAALAEARRVLAPGGRLVIGIWGDEYSELDLLRAARARLSLGDFPTARVESAVARCVEAGFEDVATTGTRLEVTHRSVPDYLAYRRSFGRPPWVPEDRRDEWLPAVEAESAAYVDADGQVRFDWAIVVLEARRPAEPEPRAPAAVGP